MRLFFFLLLFSSMPVFAQLDVGTGALGACLDTDPAFANGGTFECATLTMSGSPAFTTIATPLIIKVTGAVTISGVVDLSGDTGVTRSSFAGGFLGGDGGPGAGDGGGDDGGGTSLPGMNIDSTAPDATIAAGGGATPTGDTNCGDGGGGGGFNFTGIIGGACTTGTPGFNPGIAGLPIPSTDFSFTGPFRGGVGGGAGGDSTNPQYGAGGGGGGAIRIIAGGDITITGSIIADGGAGGNGGPDSGPGTGGGGGGGGGSGGVIWLQSLGNINHSGVLRADGALGGGANSGAPGGNGGDGFIRLEDSDGIITGGGSLPGYEEILAVSPTSSSSATLKSDISCGMIKPAGEKDHAAFFQMMMGFLIVMSVSFFMNRLKLFSKTQI